MSELNLNPYDNALLAALRPGDLERLRPHLRPVRLERGTALIEPGSRVDRIYFPLSCMVSQTVPMADGGTAETFVVGRENAAGLLAALGGRTTATHSMAQIPGDVLRLETGVLLEAFEASPALRRVCLAFGAVQLEQVLQLAACNALHPVEARLARWLLMVQDRTEATSLPLTHEFLAQMLGVQRPTVTIVARTLQGIGLIAYRRGAVAILDRPGLEEVACECYAVLRKFNEGVLDDLGDAH